MCLSTHPFLVDDVCIYDRDIVERHPICPTSGESVCSLCDDCNAAEVVAS